jgi:hypothetical protein
LYGCQAGSSFQVDTFELCPKMLALPFTLCMFPCVHACYLHHTCCHCWQYGFVHLVCFFSTFCKGKNLLMMLVVLYQNVTYVIYFWACIQLLFSLERFIVNGILNWIRSACFSLKCFSFEFNDTVKYCIVISDISTGQEIVMFRIYFVAWSKKLCIWSLENEKLTL